MFRSCRRATAYFFPNQGHGLVSRLSLLSNTDFQLQSVAQAVSTDDGSIIPSTMWDLVPVVLSSRLPALWVSDRIHSNGGGLAFLFYWPKRAPENRIFSPAFISSLPRLLLCPTLPYSQGLWSLTRKRCHKGTSPLGTSVHADFYSQTGHFVNISRSLPSPHHWSVWYK